MTVATVPFAAYYFMPEIIRSFQARYPQVRIRLIDSSVGNVIEAVSSGQADFGLCFAKNLPASIEFTPSGRRPLCGRLSARPSAGRQDAPSAGRHIFEQDYIGLDRVSGNRTLLDRELAHLTPARPSICETRHVTTMLGWWKRASALPPSPRCQCPLGEHSVLRAVPLTDPVVTRTVGLIRLSGRIQSTWRQSWRS